MGFILFTIALVLLLFAGSGIYFLVVPSSRRINLLELSSLSALYGIAFVSLVSFILSRLMSGEVLRFTLSAICVLLGGAGLLRLNYTENKITYLHSEKLTHYIPVAFLLLEIFVVTWVSFHTPLGWDGLFNWEMKARLAYENGGVIPTDYFSSSALWWSHREYPLLVPLYEAWFYGWMGVAHQGVTKLVLLLFYLVAAGLLAIGEGRVRWLAPLALFFVPLAWVGDGSAGSGYADFPLAVYYLAATIYAGEYWDTESSDSLRLFSSLSVFLPWIKQEGTILWVTLIGLIIIRNLWLNGSRQKQMQQMLMVVLPGATVLIGWTIHLRFFRISVGQDYLPLTVTTLQANWERVPVILKGLIKELLNWRYWGGLWIILLPSLLFLRLSQQYKRMWVFMLSIVAPIFVYLWLYLFISTANMSLEGRLENSLSRLLLQVSLVAVLLIGMALGKKDSANEAAKCGTHRLKR